jgi:biotin carboxyl carrier protein
MKRRNILSIVLLAGFPVLLSAQNDKQQGTKMVLTCPFEHGSGREPKEAFTWMPPDQKVIMISRVDSIVRSCIKATVVKVVPAEDNYFEIVINVNDLYFWYYGAMKPLVRQGQTVNPGQTIAIYTLGTELEFRMFKNEDMVDPRDLLECKVPKAE